jgi:hypothetical protein
LNESRNGERSRYWIGGATVTMPLLVCGVTGAEVAGFGPLGMLLLQKPSGPGSQLKLPSPWWTWAFALASQGLSALMQFGVPGLQTASAGVAPERAIAPATAASARNFVDISCLPGLGRHKSGPGCDIRNASPVSHPQPMSQFTSRSLILAQADMPSPHHLDKRHDGKCRKHNLCFVRALFVSIAPLATHITIDL